MYPAIRITDSVFIPTYLLIISLTYTLALFWVIGRARARQLDMTLAIDLSLAIMVGGFIGARFFHVIYEEPNFYIQHPIEIFKVWNGGFVFYGGFLGGLIAALGALKLKKAPFGLWADLFAPVLAVGYAIGRVACFLNGCCYGEVCDLPWAIKFPIPGLPYADWVARHPTQLYAVVWESAVAAGLLILERKRLSLSQITNLVRPAGTLFFIWMFFHGVGRILMESLRADDRGPLLVELSVSTWISVALMLSSVVAIYIFNSRASATSD